MASSSRLSERAATGTSYGIVSPLTHGVTSVVDEADFDAERWYRILAVLHRIAPEAELESVPAGADLREELDIDSLDVLRFATGLAEATGVDIPERDYPRIVTIDGCIAYLAAATR